MIKLLQGGHGHTILTATTEASWYKSAYEISGCDTWEEEYIDSFIIITVEKKNPFSILETTISGSG